MDYDTADRRKRQFGLLDKASTDAFRKSFEMQFEKALDKNCETVLIVNEHLSRLRNVTEVERLRKFLSRHFDDIRIVVYLRRQDKLMRSMYSTRIKIGLTSDEVFPARPENRNSVYTHYDFRRILDLWTRVWGRDAVTPRIFERDLLIGRDALSDFLHLADVTPPKGFVPVRANESISPQALVAIREINKHLPKEWKYRGDIGRIASRCFPGDGIPVSRRESCEFLSHFEDGNDHVARAFFDREKLFDPVREDEFDGADKAEEISLTVPDMASIFAKLWAQSAVQKNALTAERNQARQQKRRLAAGLDRALEEKQRLIAERDRAIRHPFRTLWSRLRNRLRKPR
ncbi:hypothetical protein L1965_11425 [Paracoccus sp. EGI L200073]|nr:hypothetical protein [Paracoccus salsus]